MPRLHMRDKFGSRENVGVQLSTLQKPHFECEGENRPTPANA